VDIGDLEPRHLDDFYSFFISCFHLKDWIKNDDAVRREVRDTVEQWVNESQWLRWCADIANGFKHLVINRSARESPDARLERVPAAFQEDAFQADAFQVGGVIVTAHDFVCDAKGMTDRCLDAWDEFLTRSGLLTHPPRAT